MRTIVAYSIIMFMLSSCIPRTSTVQESELIRNFFIKTKSSERIKEFKNYNIEEQYELFIFGNQVIHPPTRYLADPFVERGSTLVPFLKVKLRAAQDDITIHDITYLFLELARTKRYDVSNDQEILALLDQLVQGMRGLCKYTVEGMIVAIRLKYSNVPTLE